MAYEVITVSSKLMVEECCNCHMRFAMSSEFYKERRDDHNSFYCPAGHAQHYTGQSENERLKQELANERESVEYLRNANGKLHTKITNLNYSIRAQKAAKTKILNRVKNGVCPCCNRTFGDLQRHFKTKHPELLTTKQ